MKKIIIHVKQFLMLFCITFIISAILTNHVRAEEILTPVVEAKSAILMDMASGRVLWEKNADEPLSMASTTKIMTAILAIEHGGMKDVVTVSKRVAQTPPVKMNLTVGEKIRLEDLLYALMLQSSNDAGAAIAEHIGGSIENFCVMMTKRAKELGAKDTVFKTPNGLDLEDHHSTARDMALITSYALRNKDFVRIINTREVKVPVSGGDFKSYHIYNKNRLLNEYLGAFGVKTGYTGKAGHCFVGAAEKNGMKLISVVLASGWGNRGKEQKWVDTKRVLNYGFDNFSYVSVVEPGKIVKDVSVLNSREKSTQLALKEGFYFPLRSDELDKIEVLYLASDVVDSPIQSGDVLGKAVISIDGKQVGHIDLLATTSVARHDFKTSLNKIVYEWLKLGSI